MKGFILGLLTGLIIMIPLFIMSPSSNTVRHTTFDLDIIIRNDYSSSSDESKNKKQKND